MIGDALRQQVNALFLNSLQLNITSSWGVNIIENLDQRRSQTFFEYLSSRVRIASEIHSTC